jgi:DNA-binding transcriptional MerR regulator
MAKSEEAFRTIGEVSDELNVPKHVLRFWEGRFPQIKPLKRGGGRRFYRPEDVLLLRGIHHLLYRAGLTIKGVQQILKDQGVEAVKSAPTDGVPLALPAVAKKAARKRSAGALPSPTVRLQKIIAELETCLQELRAPL